MYLEIKSLTKIFEKDRGVEGIELGVKRGELVTLLGPSGCGKTTLLNLIGGFLRPDAGSIRIEGADITNIPPERRPLATVFQNYALFPHMDVIENVSYGLKYSGLKKREQREEAIKYLNIVGLSGYENFPVQTLSGGQQQRVALARALVLRPKLLLLDEPFSNLDARLKITIREELRTLQKKLDITMVFVTHDQEEALSLSDRIVVMDRGRIAQVGTPEEVYHSPTDSYVASFVGKANFLKDGGKKCLVRPENISLESCKDGEWVIKDREFMGSHTLFTLQKGEETLISQIYGEDAQKYSIGDTVKKYFKKVLTF